MRILHLGWGFRPWRVGGLISYAEDLMQAQARRGHDVAYLCNGRHVPVPKRPQLRRWMRDGVSVYELMNSAHPQGGDRGLLDPSVDLAEPVAEAAFRHVLDRVGPDLLHIQELGGFPSSIVDVVADAGVPAVMTTHDYVPLCPTVKLFDAEERNCRRQRPGEMCQVCCAGAPADDRALVTQTLMHHVVPGGDRGLALLRDTVSAMREVPVAGTAVDALLSRVVAPPPPSEDDAPPVDRTATPEAYDRRRAVNVERLNRLDKILPNSTRVGEIYAELGVAPERLRVVHLAPRHLAAIRASERVEPGDPLRFVTLNGCASTQKGAGIVLDALERLRDRRFRLDVWGYVSPGHRASLQSVEQVALRGSYSTGGLSEVLADADVGIVPSAWEETFGFTGVECVAAGVPVIGNRRGGITDYTVDGESGWVNEPADGAGLAAIMARLIDAPGEVAALRARLRAHPSPLVRTLDAHADELDEVYAGVLAARR